MAKGDIVLIRSKKGEPGVRRIWEERDGGPFVCHEQYWGRYERTGIAPVCWQIGADQVRVYDQELARELETAFAQARAGDTAAEARLAELWKKTRPRQ